MKNAWNSELIKMMVIFVRSVSNDENKYYHQVFLIECLDKPKGRMRNKEIFLV